MPLRPMVTPLSLYMLDDTVFDGLQLPTPPTNPTDYPDLYIQGFQLDRDVLVDNILMETCEMNVLYTDPVFMKYAIGQWSKKELPVWQALYDTLFYKYNPLWNKDGTIKETARDLTSKETEGSRTKTGTSDQSVSETVQGTDTHNLTDTRTPNTNTHTVDLKTNTGTVTDAGSGSYHEEHDGDVTTDTTGQTLNTGTVGNAGTDNKTTTHGGNVTTSGSTGTETKVSAFNDSTYQNRDKTDTTSSQTVTDASTIAENDISGNTRTDNLAEDRTETVIESDRKEIDSNTTTGNTRTDDLTENYDRLVTETGSEAIAHTGTLGRSETTARTSEGSDEESEDTTGSESGSLDHTLTRTETGNIGVTMTTQLIEAQRALVKLNFYDLIIESFKERFCLLVY